MRKSWLATSGLTMALLTAAGAHAQTVQPRFQAGAAPNSAANCGVPNTPGCEAAISEVVVTGSRIQTTILDSPTPVVAVTSAQLEQTGTDNLERALTQLPAVAPGFTDTNSENFYAMAGLNLIDLRHLGYGRTLVLVNGRRQVPGDIYSQAVDINTIPAPLVDRVEVVTGGVSAVYGADAVSGVVNIITKDHYEGFDARLRGGITNYRDGEQWGASFLAGHNFADGRANVTWAFEFDHSQGVNALRRPWGRDTVSVIPNNSPTGPDSPTYITVHNARFFGINQKGFIAVAPFGAGDFYTPINNGTAVQPFDYGDLSRQSVNDVMNNGVAIGGDAGYFRPFDNLSLPLKRYATSLNFTYQLAPQAELFAEARLAESWVETRWQPPADFEYGEFFVPASNPYVPNDLRQILATRGQPGFYYGREYTDAGRRGADNDRMMQQYTVGLRGTLGSRFKYEAFAGYGRSDLRADLVGARSQVRFLQSVDVTQLNGQIVCADPAARAAGCQPFNPFEPASTPAGIAYSIVPDTYKAHQSLAMAGANISGDLFDLPAGPLSAALGVETRRNDARTSGGTCGLQMLCEAPERGHIGVSEVFGEVRIPLLKDLPFIHDVSFQGAVRYSDYSTNGGQTSWNLGGVYSPVESINFRIMRSRSVRAPNVDELFATQSQAFTIVNDPCSVLNLPLNANRAANCSALGVPPTFAQTTDSKAYYTGGNRNLEVETADTWTAGVTVAPRFIPHLSFTLDYFQIDLTNAIGALDPQTLLYTCTDLPAAPNSNPACGAITRNPTTHQISGIFSNNQNLGRVYTSGYDINATYDVPLQDIWGDLPGRLVLNATGTYLQTFRQFDNEADPSTQHQYEGFLGLPKWEWLGTATYSLDKLSVTWRLRYLDSTSVLGSQLVAQPTPSNLYDLQTTGSKVYNDLSVAYQVNADTSIRVNVNNIFNVTPPDRTGNINEGISYGSPYAAAGIYPNLGTMFSFVLQHKFF